MNQPATYSVWPASAAVPWKVETTQTLKLGLPLAVAELGWMSTYIVDAIMVGRMQHSALAISASSLGNSIFYAIVFTAIGLLFGLDTLVSQAFGRADLEDCNYSLVQSLFLVALLTPLVMLATSFSPYALIRFGVDASIVAETKLYIHALNWSAAPLLLYTAARRYLQAIDRPILIMVSLLTANLVNLVGDWALIYGHLGARPMGIAGSGWATCIVRVYMLALLAAGVTLTLLRTRTSFHSSYFVPDWGRLKALLTLGWPVGVQSLAELSVATCITILAGRLGVTMLAAHQVVLDLNAFVYMVPLGLSAATAVRVGHAAGRHNLLDARRAGSVGLALAAGMMSVAALSFLLMPRMWAHIYTTDPKVITASVPIFFLCAGSQILNAAQVVLAGALRGVDDTKTAMYADLGWYWLFGVPISAVLCFHFHLGLVGLWLGGALAAIPIALTLWVVWRRRTKTHSRSTIPVMTG